MAQKRTHRRMVLVVPAMLLSAPLIALADTVTTSLSGFEEVAPIRSNAEGNFQATLNERTDQLSFRPSYSGISTPVQFAHIHFAQRGVNEGIAVWLCDNSGTAPSGVQACPNESGTVKGTVGSADVVGPVEQGLVAPPLTVVHR